MSTPTSGTPQGEPEDDSALTPADRAAMGQHAAPRPYPPSPGRPGEDETAVGPGGVPAGPMTGDAGQASAGEPAAATGEPAAEPGPPPPPPPPTAAGGTSTAPAPPPGAGSGAGGPVPPPGTPTGTTPPPAPAAQAGGGRRVDDQRPVDASRPQGTGTGDRAGGDAQRDLPEPPPKPGAGRHLLGVLLGLVLTPIALLVVGIGAARLADIAGTADMGTDALGLTLLVVGVLLLAVVVLLGAWTPAVPITGGAVWGLALGIAYMVFPVTMGDTVERLTGDREPEAVDQLTDGAMSGQLVVIGTLLVAAGVAAAIARRRGRRWAEGVAAAEAARTQAVAGERDRIRLDADARARENR